MALNTDYSLRLLSARLKVVRERIRAEGDRHFVG